MYTTIGTSQLRTRNNNNIVQPLDDYISFSKALKKVASSVQKSIVSIDIYEKGVDDFINQKNSATETTGVIIGTVGSEYIILTNYNSIQGSDTVVVRFEEKTEVTAQIIGKDKLQAGVPAKI